MFRTPALLVLALAACDGGNIGTEEEVEGCPAMGQDAVSLAWVEALIGEEEVLVLTLSNSCDEGTDLEVDAMVPGGSGFTVAQEHYTIAAGGAASVVVTFLPPDYQTRTSELWLSSNDPAQPNLTVPLEGTVSPDQDLDGYAAEEVAGPDCDDFDPEVHPGAEEIWNGKDDDCDGHVDDLGIDAAVVGWLDGGGYTDLAWLGNLGAGDLDGDGAVEVVMGTSSSSGTGFVVEGADYADYDDRVERFAEASWTGAGYYNYFGMISRTLGDVTGDGIGDLVVAGSDSYTPDEQVALGVFEGGSDLRGELLPADAAVAVRGIGTTYLGGVASGLDLDGDGVAEVAQALYGVTHESYSDGAVYLYDMSAMAGDIATSDADAVLWGEYYSYFGTRVSGGDWDGDGYDDLAVGNSYQDDGGYQAGAFYLFAGGAGGLPSGTAEEVFDGKIIGTEAYAYVGADTRLVAADFDGDGAVSLVVGVPYLDQVHVFHGGVWAYQDIGDADVIIDGSVGPDYFGLGLAAGDFDGDGRAELAVGAPDSDSYYPSGSADKGMLMFFDLSGSRTRLDLGDAEGRIVSDERTAMFGQTLLAVDLDGDGVDELVVDAPGHSEGSRVYFIATR